MSGMIREVLILAKDSDLESTTDLTLHTINRCCVSCWTMITHK